MLFRSILSILSILIILNFLIIPIIQIIQSFEPWNSLGNHTCHFSLITCHLIPRVFPCIVRG